MCVNRGFVQIMEKAGKLWNLSISVSRPGKSWNLILLVMESHVK